MKKLHMSIAAILFGLVAVACSTIDPDVTSQLEAQSNRLSQLEDQIEDFSASLDVMTTESMDGEHEQGEEEHAAMESSAFQISVAQYVMDTAEFHAIDDALAETSEIDPTYASAVTRVARIVGSIQWPDDLAEGADHLVEVLVEFQSALIEDDAEAALPLAGMAHDHQHDLSAAITAWLSGEISTEGEHEHEEDEGND